MLLAFVQKSWEEKKESKIERNRKKNIGSNNCTRTKSALPIATFCALQNYLQIHVLILSHYMKKLL
jgi:hypothetical protein